MKPVSLSSLVFPVALSLLAGCGSKEETTGSPPPQRPAASSTGGAVASGFARAGGTGAAASAAPAAESFFAGEVPASVKLKPTKTFAIGPGVLLIQPIEGWSGGKLPGYDYMAMSKDSQASFRVTASTGVTGEMNCKEISTAAAMAPLRAKNLKDDGPVVKRQVGKNKFVAREGSCTADGPNGPLEIHFINILRKDKDGFWHYAVLAGFPKGAPADLRNEAMAMARSIEYNGENGFTLP